LRDAEPSIGIIDDYHALIEQSAAESLIRTFLVDLGFKLILASRVRPTWMSTRELMYGNVLELRSDVLALRACPRRRSEERCSVS